MLGLFSRVSVLRRTLTWTTGSLTCVRDRVILVRAYTLTRGLGTGGPAGILVPVFITKMELDVKADSTSLNFFFYKHEASLKMYSNIQAVSQKAYVIQHHRYIYVWLFPLQNKFGNDLITDLDILEGEGGGGGGIVTYILVQSRVSTAANISCCWGLFVT